MSPGLAPLTSIGPLKTCTTDRSTSRTSFGLSLFLIWPSVQSLHSIRNDVAGIDGDGGGNVGVPAVVADELLLGHRLFAG